MVRYPSLYQINTRVWLRELSDRLGRAATLADIPDDFLDQVAALGFDYVWFLGLWQTGQAGREVSLSHHEWLQEFQATLPGFTEADISGSPFAVTGYTLHQDFGAEADLVSLKKRLQKRKLKLLVDFVPNHTAPDHPWVKQHPEFYIQGSEADLEREPHNYRRVETPGGSLILAYGRDPYFAGWPDTLQLNYGNPELQRAMMGELERIAGQCDGVRCDMAMLVLPEIFERTWGRRADLFWPKAIESVRRQHLGFVFMAEVYWDLESRMLEQGFDWAYDKRLYDRLVHDNAESVRAHLTAGLDYQDRLVRFIENHDEPRAAALTRRMKAASVTGPLDGPSAGTPLSVAQATSEEGLTPSGPTTMSPPTFLVPAVTSTRYTPGGASRPSSRRMSHSTRLTPASPRAVIVRTGRLAASLIATWSVDAAFSHTCSSARPRGG